MSDQADGPEDVGIVTLAEHALAEHHAAQVAQEASGMPLTAIREALRQTRAHLVTAGAYDPPGGVRPDPFALAEALKQLLAASEELLLALEARTPALPATATP